MDFLEVCIAVFQGSLDIPCEGLHHPDWCFRQLVSFHKGDLCNVYEETLSFGGGTLCFPATKLFAVLFASRRDTLEERYVLLEFLFGEFFTSVT